jgi:antitoxin component of MazEF toxin-antitoxin module
VKLKTIFRSGGSLVIPIPKDYAAALRMTVKTQCIVTVKDRRLIIEKAVITGAGGPPADAPGVEFQRG